MLKVQKKMADVFRDMKLRSLSEKTGYGIVQENGQRKYGPPPGWIGPPPAKGSEIFIGKLPRDVYEHELVPLCEQFGKIYELRLMMEYNGENRGYAFVTYTNIEDATKAIKGLDDYEIRPNRHIGVCKSIDNCRLFIGGIPKEKSKDEIMNEISKFTEGVSKVILYSSILDKTKNRGFAFVEFESHRAAAMARRKLISSSVKLFDHEIAVDWAQPEAQVEDETMKRFLRSTRRQSIHEACLLSVKVLYVRNLSAMTSEEDLHVLFSMGGTKRIERVKKMKDFAFIHFIKREDAECALEQFDGICVDGCTLEVTWAKPPETQKQKLLSDKRNQLTNFYRNFSFDALEHGLDLSLLSNSPSLSDTTMRSRFSSQNLNSRNPFTVTRPIQLLNYICLENGWGEPEYRVSCIESDSSEIFFVCVVTIPGFPPQNQKIMSDKVCRTPEDARYHAASNVLRKLGITDIDGPISTPPSLTNGSSFTSTPKPFMPTNGSLSYAKSGVSNIGLSSTPKSVSNGKPFNSKFSIPCCFGEHGQGDVGNFMATPHPSFDTSSTFDDLDGASLLDPNTPIEPTSILGLIASMAAASTSSENSLFSKPKL